MPASMTFTSLQVDIRNYLERGGATDPIVYEQIPRLITLAERRIARELKIQGFQTVVNTTMQSGVAVYAKPDRWRDTISINFGTGTNNNVHTPVFPRAYEYVRSYWPNETTTGQPLFYADYDYKHWIFVPTPAADYPMEILYYELPPLLDDTNQTNWLTEFAPNLLLYGSLVEATPFVKDDQRVQLWQTYYDRSLAALNGEDLQKIVDRSTNRREA
jgi:hypothetical protein